MTNQLTCMWPQMVGLSGMPKASFFFFCFLSPFSFSESSPGVSEVLSLLLGFPSGDVKLLRFAEGFSAKNFRQTECKSRRSNILTNMQYTRSELPCVDQEESR